MDIPPDAFPTKYWHFLDDERIQCDLCPRFCKLREGQRGLCFVRARKNDAIVLTTYGRSSGFCIDPIEKKPLNHFYPGSSVLSFGTAGCNLACKFCQNYDISKSRQMDTLADSAMPIKLAQVANALNCTSIAFTYNDPVIFLEYAVDAAIACHQQNIKTVAVTAGYICPKPRAEFFKHMDAANIDLKAFSDKFYKKITGSKLAPILDTLLYLKHETQVWFEITTLLIPGENDSNQEVEQMCNWISKNLGNDIPLHFSAFHPDWKMRDKPHTPPKTLTNARHIALSFGMNYVYTGNVHDLAGDCTFCPSCKKPIIERDWYQIFSYQLDKNGRCKYCHHPIAGKFANTCGNWGAKRQVVQINKV